MPDNNDDKEPVPVVTRFFRACLLALAGIFALYLGLHLLAQVWGWLLLLVAIAGFAYAVIWFIRWRRDRRW